MCELSQLEKESFRIFDPAVECCLDRVQALKMLKQSYETLWKSSSPESENEITESRRDTRACVESSQLSYLDVPSGQSFSTKRNVSP